VDGGDGEVGGEGLYQVCQDGGVAWGEGEGGVC
jgi:hypothetical protein